MSEDDGVWMDVPGSGDDAPSEHEPRAEEADLQSPGAQSACADAQAVEASLGPAVVGVSFRRTGKVYDFRRGGVNVRVGDQVLTRTERGVDIGHVVYVIEGQPDAAVWRGLKPLVRKVTAEDLRQEERLRERELEAARVCEERIAAHRLPMKLIEADYTFDGRRLTFYFSAETRVDFRALVRDLAQTFHCRIELRQVGVRDEAKFIGGLGPCGRPLCCTQFLRNFDPVSIRLAKDQGLSLNPEKISGVCDRLMCCLRYEQETYRRLAIEMPKVGAEVVTPHGPGVVTDALLLRGRVIVRLATTGQFVEVAVSELGDQPQAPPHSPPAEEEQTAPDQASVAESDGAGEDGARRSRRGRRRRRKPASETATPTAPEPPAPGARSLTPTQPAPATGAAEAGGPARRSGGQERAAGAPAPKAASAKSDGATALSPLRQRDRGAGRARRKRSGPGGPPKEGAPSAAR